MKENLERKERPEENSKKSIKNIEWKIATEIKMDIKYQGKTNNKLIAVRKEKEKKILNFLLYLLKWVLID